MASMQGSMQLHLRCMPVSQHVTHRGGHRARRSAHTVAAQGTAPGGSASSRRDLLLATVVGLAAQQLPLPAFADEEQAVVESVESAAVVLEPAAAAPPRPAAVSVEQCLQNGGNCLPFKALRDETLAYEFVYPVRTAGGKQLPLVLSRKPERYSSAAPLTADARQRIVCELIDLKDAVTVSVSVGPPSGILRDKPPAEWKPRSLATSVLVDRSTARVTTGQRVSLSNVEEASSEVREDGVTYYVYEHVSQGAPRLGDISLETYRHSYAVSATRLGIDGTTPFIYTLNLSCPEELWPELQDGFLNAVNSFRLTAPTKGYVAPDQDPWRFF